MQAYDVVRDWLWRDRAECKTARPGRRSRIAIVLLALTACSCVGTKSSLAAGAQLPDQISLEQSLIAALDRADGTPADAAAQIAKIEALLALGRPAAAEQSALALAASLASPDNLASAEAAEAGQQITRVLRLWTLARLRQALPLDEPRIAAYLDYLSDEPALTALRFWSQSLAGRAPYRFQSGSLPAEIELQRLRVWSRFHARQLEHIAATIGELTLPVVFFDTGAQYTLLSADAARAAGVVPAEHASEMVGFASFNAVPGLIPELRLGDLVLRDVPVFVGQSPALARAKGQMAIGTDLLQHLRLTLDVDAGRARIEPAFGATPLDGASAPESWQVRLWPLVQACLAEAHLADDRHARVLIDTGNWEGTFVSARWARGSRLDLRAQRFPPWMQLKPEAGSLAGLELGGQTFADQPVRGLLPAELERLDLVDIVVGHDLLDHQRVTIDLAQRLLRCERTQP